ncbi:hypothetical protein [Streptomyces sp. NBC_01296]|nr:hypothetical protein OG299_01755 [Streptomyces sp. NBC_01296]
MAHSAWVTGVGYLGQTLQQPGYLIGSELRMLAELVKGTRDRR